MERHRFYGYLVLNSYPDHKVSPCPVCDSVLSASGMRYSLEEIFSLWHPIEFDDQVVSEHIAISPSTELFICENCQLEIFLPQVIGKQSFYEEVSTGQSYDLKGYYEDSKWEFGEALRDVSRCTSLIEFGCGPGNFLKKVKQNVHQIAGVEINKHAADVARMKGINVYHPDHMPENMIGRYDAAVSFHVLEHVSDPKAFLKRLSRFVKPNGLIGISVPNQDGPIQYIEPCAMNMPPHHATRWRLKTFEVLAESLGWKIQRVAFEPLLLENHSYYSIYWLNQILPGSSGVSLALRSFLSLALKTFFSLLRKVGLKYFLPLRGQTIYIIMSNNST